MDTVVFSMILGAFAVMLRSRRRLHVIGAWAACLLATLVLFEHDVTSTFNLRF